MVVVVEEAAASVTTFDEKLPFSFTFFSVLLRFVPSDFCVSDNVCFGNNV